MCTINSMTFRAPPCMIKYAKFKFNKNSMIFFLVSLFFNATPTHILQKASVLQNMVWKMQYYGDKGKGITRHTWHVPNDRIKKGEWNT